MKFLGKIRKLPKKYVLIGAPLLCGIIIGTTITMSIPKIQADLTVSDQGSTNATPVPVQIDPNNPKVISNVSPIQPTAVPPTNSPIAPTNIPAQQNNTNQAVVPCK